MSGPFRLICALLTLLLALPAMQANACAPRMSDHAGHALMAAGDADHDHHGAGHSQPAPEQPRHDCVGCIPPIDIGAYRAAEEPGLSFPRTGKVVATPYGAALSAPPEPPPPRITV